MGAKTFILEVEWVWDHYNTELVTITFEDFEDIEKKFENNLPNKELMKELKNRFETVDRSLLTRGRMIRLYKIVNPKHGCIRLYPLEKSKTVELNLKLEVICEFDNEENPIPIK